MKITKFILPVLFILTASWLCSCGSHTLLEAYASDLKDNIEEFKDQKEEAITSVTKADSARKEVFKNKNISIKDSKARTFVDKWNNAEEEIKLLRKKFNETIKSADYLFTSSEAKTQLISDEILRDDTMSVLLATKSGFSIKAKRTDEAISTLEDIIMKGNDIILSLEVTSAISQIQADGLVLDNIFKEANSKLPALNDLIDEGMKLANASL